MAVLEVPGRLARRLDRLGDRSFGALFSAPGLLVVALVVAPPVLSVFGMSLFRIDLLKTGGVRFVGLQNFTNMFKDSQFLASIPRTLVFAAAATALTVPLALAAALALNRVFRGQKVLSIVLLMPWAVAPIVTGLYWRFIFQPQFGLATGFLHAFGLSHGSVDWLGDPHRAVAIAVIATAWRSIPLLALLIGTALRTIPQNQIKAAQLDGATPWSTFRYIRFPAIRNMLLVGTVLQVILSLQVFDIIFTLTRGGPGYETTVMYYFIYNTAFGTLNFGYSAALSVVLVLFIVVFTAPLIYLRQRARRSVSYQVSDDTAEEPGGPAAAEDDTDALIFYDDDKKARRPHMPLWLRTSLRRAGVGVLFAWLAGPIVWIVVASVQPTKAITHAPPHLTVALTFSHFKELLTGAGWYHSILVSVEVAIGTTFFTILIAALAAYPLARLDIPGKSIALTSLLFVQTVPGISLAIPVLLLFRHLHLQDSVAALIIVDTAFLTPIAIWILRNVFEDVPLALEKAARMDGCSRIGTLFRITMPAAKSGVAATAILVLISAWNDFLFAVVLGNKNAVTVTRRIGFLETPHSLGNSYSYDLLAAGGVLAALPCIVLVAVFHRRIVSGLTEGYGKG